MPPDVREVIQDLDEKEFEEELNDEQREVMEDIWLKADEMGKKINVTYILAIARLIKLYSLFLDVTEVSYNNGNSRLPKNQKKLNEMDFTSDEDYNCRSSYKNKRKKKSQKKKRIKKNTKSKKKIKKTEVTKFTAEKNEITISPIEIINNQNKIEIEKVITYPMHVNQNINNINFLNTKQLSEESMVEKRFKEDEDSSVTTYNNCSDHDYSLLKNVNSFKNSDLNSSRVMLPTLPDTSCNLPSTSVSSIVQYNIQKPRTIPVPKLLCPTVNVVPLKIFPQFGQKYLAIEKPTLEPIQVKQNSKLLEGM